MKNEIDNFCSLKKAFVMLRKEEEVEAFLKDLCTPKELKAMEDRWLVCQILEEKKESYQEIHNKTKVSITTIGRVARFLFNESYKGYGIVLNRLKGSN